MRKCIKINEDASIQNYINDVERVLKQFDGIDLDKLKSAEEMVKDELKSEYKDRKGKVSSYLIFNGDVYHDTCMCIKNLKVALDILKGGKNFKVMWELPYARGFDTLSEPYPKGSNPPKKWKDACELLSKAMRAVTEYRKLLYNSRGSDSDLQREIKQIIKSGGLYKETIKDLNEICSIFDEEPTHTITDYKVGELKVFFSMSGLSKRGLDRTNSLESKIRKFISSNKDMYPEIDINYVKRVKNPGNYDDSIIGIFSVALEKIPKTNIVAKTSISSTTQGSVQNLQSTGTYDNFKVPNRDIQKMSEYFNKGSNPKTLANTVKDVDKAVSRYYIAVATGWKECEDSFYARCIELGVSEGDLKDIRDQALKDKSINIGNSSNSTSRVNEPSGTTPNPQKSTSNNRKVIDADTGFLMTRDDSSPFS